MLRGLILELRMKRVGVGKAELARAAGMTVAQLTASMEGRRPYTEREAARIAQRLELWPDEYEMFFGKEKGKE